MKKELVSEVIWLRCLACLTVVAIHCINMIFTNYEGVLSNPSVTFLEVVKLALLFGTPTFVFISEFLLAKSYPNHIPDQFLWKRVRYILIPYITMAVVYALYSLSRSGDLTTTALLVKIVRNIVAADYIAYFIIVIFQFYVLHIIFTKYFQKISPKLMIFLCLVINLIYLGFFNFVPPLYLIPGAEYLWNRFYWIPFPGWLFYFSVAYYCGRNHAAFREFLDRYIKWFILSSIVSFLVILSFRFSDLLPEGNSKRIDMLLYTISVIFVAFYLTSKIKEIPWVIDLVSRYSFGIYLLHLIFVQNFSEIFDGLNPWINIPLTFVLSIGVSILLTFVLHKLRIGSYFVGKIGAKFSTKTKNIQNENWVEKEVKV